MVKYLLAILFFSAIVIVVIGAYLVSGRYNVAATEPHWGLTKEILEIARDRSIIFHSKDVQYPFSLDGAKIMSKGIHHFHEMCRLCHGAPGYDRSEFALGLYPSPPSLTAGHMQEEMNRQELYWIVKHGLKMTGMPAFGPTHSEEELWGIVALTEQLPNMEAAGYTKMLQESEQGDQGSHEDSNH